MTISWPWKRWAPPAPTDPGAVQRALAAIEDAKMRERRTREVLERRRRVVKRNHLAHDIRQALERHS